MTAVSKPTFSEMERIEKLYLAAQGIAQCSELARVKIPDGPEFPIYSFIFGPRDPSVPTLCLVGGVHGLERIGTQVILAFLESLVEQWSWDQDVAKRFENVRLAVIPCINPGGFFKGTRSNPNGVDLMRNSPVEASVKPAFILGGHRLSPRLPYYRGVLGAPMEVESQGLVDFVRREVFPADVSLVIDFHSGFGARDRLWYPYAKTDSPFPRLKEVDALHLLLNRSSPHHVYMVEPQSLSYTTHGDLWDHMFDEHVKEYGLGEKIFIPWTLEMGSWIWVKKNPAQIFSTLGVFNPIKEHRIRRTMRRHMPLIDFFLRAVKNSAAWRPRS